MGFWTFAVTFWREWLSEHWKKRSWRWLPFFPNGDVQSWRPCSTSCWWRRSSVRCSRQTCVLLHTHLVCNRLVIVRGWCLQSGVSLEQWTAFYDPSEDLGGSVRLDWESGSPVETTLRDSRAFAAFLTTGLPWEEVFSCRFRTPRHINALELEALISLVQRLANCGTSRVRILVIVDIRLVVGAVSKGRPPSRQVNFQHRRLGVILTYGRMPIIT